MLSPRGIEAEIWHRPRSQSFGKLLSASAFSSNIWPLPGLGLQQTIMNQQPRRDRNNIDEMKICEKHMNCYDTQHKKPSCCWDSRSHCVGNCDRL